MLKLIWLNFGNLSMPYVLKWLGYGAFGVCFILFGHSRIIVKTYETTTSASYGPVLHYHQQMLYNIFKHFMHKILKYLIIHLHFYIGFNDVQ